jgi:hypothetical protein
MKERILYTFMIMLIGCVVNTKVAAQDFGVEQNQDGSYTLFWQDGRSLTTNTDGTYTAGSQGSCIGCLPPVTVYGYKKSGTTNEYTYTSYYYNNQYYNLPPDPNSPPPNVSNGAGPSTVMTTDPTTGTNPTTQPPPVNDPCNGYRNTPSPASISLPGYTAAVNELTSTLSTDENEKSMFMGVNTAGGLTTTPITGGSGNAANGNPGYPAFVPFAGVHTHPDGVYPMPSAGDIYNLAGWNAQYPTYTTAYVISAADNSTTAIVVTDPQKVAAFLAAHPQSTGLDSRGNWASNTPMWDDFVDAVNTLDTSHNPGSPENREAWRSAQAYILDKYDTGLTMVMKNADGTFKEVHFVKTTDAQGNVSYKKYNCN